MDQTQPQTTLVSRTRSRLETLSAPLTTGRSKSWSLVALSAAMLACGVYWVSRNKAGSENDQTFEVAPTAEVNPVAALAVPAMVPAAKAEAKKAEEVKKAEAELLPTGHFAYRSAELTASTKGMLDTWASRMKRETNLRLTIEGHADERGTNLYNLKLGQRRAAAAKAYLVSKGIASPRVSTISYGRSRPAVKGHGEVAWQKNRRIEVRAVTALSSR